MLVRSRKTKLEFDVTPEEFAKMVNRKGRNAYEVISAQPERPEPPAETVKKQKKKAPKVTLPAPPEDAKEPDALTE